MSGIYISYPFCGQKCTYCNFASGVHPRELEASYLQAVEREIRATQWQWTPETLYLGGGTPSRIAPDALARLLSPASSPAAIPGAPWREATIEVAPGDITRDAALAWRNAGINRVSLGVQSFVRVELARTGRKHTAETVESDVAILRAAGISNFSIDLIAGLPGQTPVSWNESLHWIERLQPPHVSVYMLEVDDDSRLGSEILALGRRYGARETPSSDQAADFYETAVARLSSLGLTRYEISNFARPGFQSRHNLKYWRREPYLGFGADAHSFDGVWRWSNIESAQDYVQRMNSGESTQAERMLADSSGEPLFLGLRLSQGIEADWSRFAQSVQEFVREGLLEIDGRRLRLTPRGVLLSNEVFAAFV